MVGEKIDVVHCGAVCVSLFFRPASKMRLADYGSGVIEFKQGNPNTQYSTVSRAGVIAMIFRKLFVALIVLALWAPLASAQTIAELRAQLQDARAELRLARMALSEARDDRRAATEARDEALADDDPSNNAPARAVLLQARELLLAARSDREDANVLFLALREQLEEALEHNAPGSPN